MEAAQKEAQAPNLLAGAEKQETDILEDIGAMEQSGSGKKKRKKTRRVQAAKPLPNPGKYEDHEKEAKEVLTADVFQGTRFELNYTPVQRLDKQMGFSLATHMDSFNIPGGKSLEYGVTCYTDKNVFLARVDDKFRVMGRFHHQITPNLNFRSLFQSAEDFNLMLDLDYKAKDSFTHYKLTHSPNGLVHVLSYQQSLTEAVSLGTEFLHQIGQVAHLSFVARYHDTYAQGKQADTYTAHLSSVGVACASYCHKLSPNVSLATEFTFAADPGRGGRGGPSGALDSVVHMGALYKYQSFKFQANVKSTLSLQMALEQQLAPGMTFLACSELDHLAGGSVFGFGFRLG